jgi:hypothetical protein
MKRSQEAQNVELIPIDRITVVNPVFATRRSSTKLFRTSPSLASRSRSPWPDEVVRTLPASISCAGRAGWKRIRRWDTGFCRRG